MQLLIFGGYALWGINIEAAARLPITDLSVRASSCVTTQKSTQGTWRVPPAPYRYGGAVNAVCSGFDVFTDSSVRCFCIQSTPLTATYVICFVTLSSHRSAPPHPFTPATEA